MTTPNERELAQLEREEQEDQAEHALVLVEVVARDEHGRISQWRGMREPTPDEARAIMKKEARRVPPA